MYRFFWILICFLLCSENVFAAGIQSRIDSVINADSISKTAVVSVSVKDLKTGARVYDRQSELLLHPASTLKALTTAAVLNKLTRYYDLKTIVYRFKNDVYIKLTADPLWTTGDLQKLLASINMTEVENIIVDGSLVDPVNKGVGWMWDDELNPLIPKYSVFNLDGNLVKIKIKPAETNVLISSDYPILVENNLTKGDSNNIVVNYKPWLSQDKVFLEGTVKTESEISVPVFNPEDYFLFQLKKSLPPGCKINVKTDKTLVNAIIQTNHKTPFLVVLNDINKHSNNLAAESVLKLAAFRQFYKQGTTKDGLKVVLDFYKNLGMDVSKIQIVDASGVSHNNLVSTDFVSTALYKIQSMKDFAPYQQSLARPSEDGTLKNRLQGVEVYAKTGTIAGVSGIVGYTKNYSFAILIQNVDGSTKSAKQLEDKIIRELANCN